MKDAVPRWRWGEDLRPLLAVLEGGGVVAIPTESSYGLAVDPRNRRGVEAIYEIKGREPAKALPVVVADASQALDLGVPATALAAAARLWPAPLSVLMPLAAPLAASAGGVTLAVRVPAHRRLRQLLADLGFGLTASSANRSGETPIVEPQALSPLLAGRLAIVVDDGALGGGPPSTLIEWHGDEVRILRQGAYPATRLVGEPSAQSGDSTSAEGSGGSA